VPPKAARMHQMIKSKNKGKLINRAMILMH
jgi:hypothetical protein